MATKYQSGLRVGEYVLEECVGAGTFGEVWQARHHIWDKDHVAVKLPIEPEYVRYLQREGVVVHGLRHPNIVRPMGLDPYAETPYLTMELVRGPSLRTVIGEHPQGVSLEITQTVMRGLLHGLDAAHKGGIIHRDLKPGNVLLDLDGRQLDELTIEDVKISDFGMGIGDPDTLRSMVMQSASIERDAESATIAGTLAYMAPEVRDGQPPSPQSDLYAIGVILFELLTGERPAGAELPTTLRADAPAALDEVFRRLYARKERRYESAQAVLDDLDARLSPAAPPVPPLPTATSPVRPLVTCPSCRRTIDVDDQYCTQCGLQLVDGVRQCSQCGGYPGPHDRFCIFCGAMLASPGE